MKSRDEHLSRAKQRALIRVSMGSFTHAVTGLRADLAEHSLTKGVVSSDQVRIPTKPATHSNRKPAIDSDLKPAGVPI